jgi:aspartate-semialdehyde dehydrogenase
MKFTSAIGAVCLLAATSPFQSAEAFAGLGPRALHSTVSTVSSTVSGSAFTSNLRVNTRSSLAAASNNRRPYTTSTLLKMGFSVGIVGAKGAVGKEIRQCLEKRNFPVEKLRVFGSERSAGTELETEKFGTLKIELFDVKTARECDVVFLAVDGDFALEHAKAISEGEDGAVVIDNSVSS